MARSYRYLAFITFLTSAVLSVFDFVESAVSALFDAVSGIVTASVALCLNSFRSTLPTLFAVTAAARLAWRRSIEAGRRSVQSFDRRSHFFRFTRASPA